MPAIAPVLLVVFLDLLGFGIVIPLLPFYAETFGASPLEVTLLMSVYSLGQFLCAPLWGAVSDRVGRRPVLLATIAASVLCLAGFAAARSVAALFLFRALHGIAASNVSTAQACVADLTAPEDRAKGMGLIGAAFGVGFTLGPFLGGEAARFGFSVPIWFAAGLSALNLVLAWRFLPETVRPGTRRPRPIDPRDFFRVCVHPVVGLLVVLTFATTIAFSMMESTFALFAGHVRGLGPAAVGRLLGVAGLAMIIVQGRLVGPLARRFGERVLVVAGLAVFAASLALLPHAPPAVPILLVFVGMAVGQGVAGPSLQALVSRGVGEEEQGFVLGTNQSMSALARAVGPGLAGLLFERSPAAPFHAASAVLVAGVVLALAAVRRGAGDGI